MGIELKFVFLAEMFREATVFYFSSDRTVMRRIEFDEDPTAYQWKSALSSCKWIESDDCSFLFVRTLRRRTLVGDQMFQNVHVTEVSWPMKRILSSKGFTWVAVSFLSLVFSLSLSLLFYSILFSFILVLQCATNNSWRSNRFQRGDGLFRSPSREPPYSILHERISIWCVQKRSQNGDILNGTRAPNRYRNTLEQKKRRRRAFCDVFFFFYISLLLENCAGFEFVFCFLFFLLSKFGTESIFSKRISSSWSRRRPPSFCCCCCCCCCCCLPGFS